MKNMFELSSIRRREKREHFLEKRALVPHALLDDAITLRRDFQMNDFAVLGIRHSLHPSFFRETVDERRCGRCGNFHARGKIFHGRVVAFLDDRKRMAPHEAGAVLAAGKKSLTQMSA